MDKKYILAVDNGSQSSKVVIFDLEGNTVSQGSQPLRPMSFPEHGHVEHPDDDLWDSISIACQKAFDGFKGSRADIAGVGLCTIRFCRAVLKADGHLARPLMSWMDKRVSVPHDDPDKKIAYVTTSSGYITRRFTGEFRDTAANYLGCWPFDTDTWDWSTDEKINEYGLRRDMLFSLQMPGTILGNVTEEAAKDTGIPAGIPVFATSNDKAVEALGAGLYDDDSILVSLGTYITSMTPGKENHPGMDSFWTNLASVPGKYLYESGGIRRGMWTVMWFKELLGEELVKKSTAENLSVEDFLNREAAKVPAGSCGLMTVLDWLAPTNALYKKGMMIGFDGRHTYAHIYRSILEAIALTMKNHVDAMCRDLGKSVNKLIITGGGSNSDLFMQIFADVFNVRTTRNVINGAASLGSAICAAVGLKIYTGFPEAISEMVKIRDHFDPIPENVSLYKRYNEEVFSQIGSHVDDLLKKSYNLF